MFSKLVDKGIPNVASYVSGVGRNYEHPPYELQDKTLAPGLGCVTDAAELVPEPAVNSLGEVGVELPVKEGLKQEKLPAYWNFLLHEGEVLLLDLLGEQESVVVSHLVVTAPQLDQVDRPGIID